MKYSPLWIPVLLKFHLASDIGKKLTLKQSRWIGIVLKIIFPLKLSVFGPLRLAEVYTGSYYWQFKKPLARRRSLDQSILTLIFCDLSSISMLRIPSVHLLSLKFMKILIIHLPGRECLPYNLSHLWCMSVKSNRIKLRNNTFNLGAVGIKLCIIWVILTKS